MLPLRSTASRLAGLLAADAAKTNMQTERSNNIDVTVLLCMTKFYTSYAENTNDLAVLIIRHVASGDLKYNVTFRECNTWVDMACLHVHPAPSVILLRDKYFS